MILTLEPELRHSTFSQILRKASGALTDSDAVEFDMSHVRWVEPFELSLLVCLIQQLRQEQISVRVRLPPFRDSRQDRDPDVAAFLKRIRFIHFLVERKVEIINLASIPNVPEREIGDAIAPFTFLRTQQEYDSYLTGISDDEQMQIHFGEWAKLQSIRTKELQQVVLRELGENVFDHARGASAHLLMTARRSAAESRNPEMTRVVRRTTANRLEQPFFRQLGDSPYVIVVISDVGPGIFATLTDAFVRDPQGFSASGKQSPDEVDVLEYALRFQSSSRSTDVRLGRLMNMMDRRDLRHVVPATGLFWVTQIARMHRGLMAVRSGRSQLTLDYLSHPELGYSTASSRALKDLPFLRGTQIKLYFPASDVARRVPHIRVPAQVSDHAVNSVYRFVALQRPADRDAALAEWLEASFVDLEEHRAASSDTSIVTIVDLSAWEVDESKSRKALYLLLVFLMRLQTRNAVFVLFDPHRLLESFRAAFMEPGVGTPSATHRPLLVCNDQFQFGLLGDYSTEYGIEEDFPLPHVTDAAGVLDHLVDIDRSSESQAQLRIDFRKVTVEIVQGLRARVGATLSSPPIYHTGWFLLPNGAFANGFFEVRELFSMEDSFTSAITVFRFYSQYYTDPLVISFGVTARALGAALSAALHSQHVHLTDPVRSKVELMKLRLVDEKRNIILVTDVLGTGSSIEAVMKFCHSESVCLLCAAVDCRQAVSGEDPLQSRTVALLRQPLQFWYEGKPRGVQFEHVRLIDPGLNVPLPAPRTNIPIWAVPDEDNPLWDNLHEGRAVIDGHFALAERHMIYLMVTEKLVGTYPQALCDAIVQDIEQSQYIEPTLKNAGISHVVYPEFTYGLSTLASVLVRSIPGARAYAVTRDELRAPSLRTSIQFGNVLIIDDAVASGYTLWQMVDIVQSNQVAGALIVVYVLANRSSPHVTRVLQKNQQYGTATLHVRFLSQLSIPTFRAADCPLCRSIQRLLSIKPLVGESRAMLQLIDSEINHITPHEVISSEDLLDLADDFNIETIHRGRLRERLELAVHSGTELTAIMDSLADDGVALRLISILAEEELYSVGSGATLPEAFNPLARRTVIDACERILANVGMHDSSDVLAIFRTLRILAMDRLILSVDEGLLAKLGDEHVNYLVLALLESPSIRQHARHLESSFATGLASRGHLAASTAQIWSTVSLSGSPAAEALRMYRHVRLLLDDSGDCAQLFARLQIARIHSQADAELRTLASEHWEGISLFIRERVVPPIGGLLHPTLPPVLASRIRTHLKAIGRALEAADSFVRHIAILGLPHSGVNSITREAYVQSVLTLQQLLIEDEAGTLYNDLSQLQTSTMAVVREAQALWRDAFQKAGISVRVSGGDDSIVFGSKQDVVTMVSVLLENVVSRAFPEDYALGKRVCMIDVGPVPSQPYLTQVRILDNGIGINEPLRKKGGLLTLERHADFVCFTWRVCPGPERGTEAVLHLFTMTEDLR